ncbi:hypothetical protein ACKWTF_003770 [Chironomus riparius]
MLKEKEVRNMQKKFLFLWLMILLATLADSAEITCEWDGEVCILSRISPVTQPNEAITIAGKPTNYINTAPNYFSFYMTRFNMNYIPTKLFMVFPKIIGFVMASSSPKTTLETNSIVNCDYLTALSFIGINILNVPEGFAQTCSKIVKLQFNMAGIDSIDKNAFKGLISVENLLMLYNRINCFPPDLFQTVPNLKTLELRNNRIFAIDSGLFRNLPQLNMIDMKFNSISYLPTLDFTGTAQSQFFSFLISENPIYAIKPDFCNTFNSRSAFEDIFDVQYVRCLSGDPTTVTITKSNCQGSMAIPLQKCYSNWTSTMSTSVTCAPACSQSLLGNTILVY